MAVDLWRTNQPGLPTMNYALRRGQQDTQSTSDVPQAEERGSELARLLSTARPSRSAGVPAQRRSDDRQRSPNWSEAFSLVQQTATALRASGERARLLEERIEGVIERASEELQNAQAKIEALEARLRTAEAREQRAEARAQEAEEWLQRIHDALAEELPSAELSSAADELSPVPDVKTATTDPSQTIAVLRTKRAI